MSDVDVNEIIVFLSIKPVLKSIAIIAKDKAGSHSCPISGDQSFLQYTTYWYTTHHASYTSLNYV